MVWSLCKYGCMKLVELIFPNAAALTEFILNEQVSAAEVDSKERVLKVLLSDVQIVLACTKYGAIIKQVCLAL